jgi:hypothetical protein
LNYDRALHGRSKVALYAIIITFYIIGVAVGIIGFIISWFFLDLYYILMFDVLLKVFLGKKEENIFGF